MTHDGLLAAVIMFEQLCRPEQPRLRSVRCEYRKGPPLLWPIIAASPKISHVEIGCAKPKLRVIIDEPLWVKQAIRHTIVLPADFKRLQFKLERPGCIQRRELVSVSIRRGPRLIMMASETPKCTRPLFKLERPAIGALASSMMHRPLFRVEQPTLQRPEEEMSLRRYTVKVNRTLLQRQSLLASEPLDYELDATMPNRVPMLTFTGRTLVWLQREDVLGVDSCPIMGMQSICVITTPILQDRELWQRLYAWPMSCRFVVHRALSSALQ